MLDRLAVSDRPGPPVPPPRRTLLALRVVLVRLRFVLVLAAILGVIAYWDVLRAHWDRITRPPGTEDGVSGDTEYWCPMCPGVLSSWPGKCPVCNMALVQRKKGEAVPLPDGVITRMQLSPYRLQLAGVQTTPLEFRDLCRDIILAGFVEVGSGDRTRVMVQAEAFERDLPFLEVGQAVEATSELFPGRSPFTGRVCRLGPYRPGSGRSLSLMLAVDDPGHELRPTMLVTIRVSVPTARRPWSVRAVTEEWRDRLTLDLLAHALAVPGGPGFPSGADTLVRMAGPLAQLRAGRMLAVPESAVVDTGMRKVVYVESGPGMFDGVEVVLGPRCGEYYPVLRGPEAGQRVVTAGAFLIDAETRLNLGAAAAYFGASRGSPTTSDRPAATPAATGDAKAADRALIARQKVCPVTGEPLDSMGGPVRVEVNGRIVFICCKGCEDALRSNPKKYLAKLPRQ